MSNATLDSTIHESLGLKRMHEELEAEIVAAYTKPITAR